MHKFDLERYLNSPVPTALQATRGKKFFELSNHLGNVLTTITDQKLWHTEGGNSYYVSTIKSISDYYPFGMAIAGRNKSENEYRFGFNGKENDESWGDGLIQDYGFRVYSQQYCRFFSEDPLTKKYPELTPYQFASNTPIAAIDLDGLERLIVNGTQWSDSEGNLQQSVTTTFYNEDHNNNKELDKEGVQMTLNGQTTFIEPVVVTASRTTSFAKSAQNGITKVVEKIGLIEAGKYVIEQGDELEQVGFGESTEFRNSAVYLKLSAERYSTSESNVGWRTKAEFGGRFDGSLQLSPLKGRSIFSPDNYDTEKPQIEQRFYFHFSDNKPSTKEGSTTGLTWSINSTTKIPLWGAGGIYYNYDAVSGKNEIGFYLNTNPQSFKFQTGATAKGGMKIEYNSLPK